MIFGSLITVIILILIELLFKNNSDLIAGCNAFSDKEKIDIKTQTIDKNYLIVMEVSVF